MALTEEWKHRIERWEKALWADCYRPLGILSLSGFTTLKQLTPQQALKRKFRPLPIGTRWGAKWEYGWFKGELTLPEDAQGERIVLRVDPGGEALIWVNGEAAGSHGWAYRDITLSRNGQTGQQYEILLEAYAGHGAINIGEGPVPFGIQTVPEPPSTQATVGESTFGIWREQIYQLALDFTTLFELRKGLDPRSLRVSEIDQGLMDATLVYDPELPEGELCSTADQARERLKELLACKNGSTAPTFYAFGHAHLDVAWLWPWAETERKIARTVANQLALFDEYPDYHFLQSQPYLYTMLKARYPELYERFIAAVRGGNVIPDGAMWVEADTNLSGGESLIRQVIHGKRFFQQECGAEARVLWMPDVFGYSGALPQILRGCGCIGFATAKIVWAYNGGDPFPYNSFLWEGIDGTAIPAHIFNEYNSHTHPSAIFDRWNSRLQKNCGSSMLLPFGWGDGGGGPTRDHLEFLKRAADLEGLPHVRMASPAEFFTDLEKQGLPQENGQTCRYLGELYFQAHRGTYTSQAKTKQGNRRSEFALREAEIWGSIARALNGYQFTSQCLESTWQRLLLNQFHDILPGSSIHRVYQEAEVAFSEIIADAERVAKDAAGKLTQGADGFTVFNSLSWPRTVSVELPEKSIEVTVPACGWTTIQKDGTPFGAIKTPKSTGKVKATNYGLENEVLKAEFNPRGELVSLIDKESGFETMAAPGNRFCLYKDVPESWDAWDLDSMAEQQRVSTDEPVTLEVVSYGPLVGKLKLSRHLHQSTVSQVISLRRGSRRIEFSTAVDWQESHKLLKVAFPVNIHTNEAIHEIQFGHLRRPNHRSRPYDADRFEVCNHKWSALAEEKRGVAILNDCKYGLSVHGNSINLTLLRSPLAPDMTADKGIQTFTYAIYPWSGSLADSNVVQEAYEFNVPVLVVPGEAGQVSMFSVDTPNIILETVKPAEDGSPDIILRLYESMRTSTRCHLITALSVHRAVQTDMLENGGLELPCQDGKIALEFRPFEIKTLRLSG